MRAPGRPLSLDLMRGVRMASTTNINKMTVVHAKSNGFAITFPDTCKTPSPGGPIPIPYPNIAMSKDAAQVTTTVSVDGQGIMVKGSNFAVSTGDEAGSVGGILSGCSKARPNMQITPLT